jgi:hypothetical protein
MLLITFSDISDIIVSTILVSIELNPFKVALVKAFEFILESNEK